jgi:enamine deaminase RidA (YjgF/YER057c/UK114 family)
VLHRPNTTQACNQHTPLNPTFTNPYHYIIIFFLPISQDPMPPDDPYVQVRVLRDYGEVVFTSGKVSLQRGKSHWLPRDEAHPLVMDGVLDFVEDCRA